MAKCYWCGRKAIEKTGMMNRWICKKCKSPFGQMGASDWSENKLGYQNP